MEFDLVTVVKIMSVVLATSTIALALEVHSVRHGENASITFSADVNGYAAVCELFSLSAARPFYVHERVDPTILRPDQRDRFDVSVPEKSEKHLRVTLMISNVQVDDGGVYVLSVRETKDEQASDYIYDAYVDVVVPPGKAECNVSHYTAGLSKVSCRASAGTDTGGDIVCFQDSERTLAFESTVRSADHITATFLAHACSPVSCCSVGTNEVKNQDSCVDFVEKLSRDTFPTDPPRVSPTDVPSQSGIVTLTKLLHGKEATSSSPPKVRHQYQKQEPSSGPIFKISMVFVNVLVVVLCVILVWLVGRIRKSLRKMQNGNGRTKEQLLNNILIAEPNKDVTILPNSQDFQKEPLKTSDLADV